MQTYVDTGSKYIYGDSTTISKIMSKIGASATGDGRYYVKQSKVSSMSSKKYL